jgi:CO/xanthine dehydrogenase Mo-binding subunit
MTFADMPKLDIELINRLTEPPLGVSEAACAPVGAALANGVHDASGVGPNGGSWRFDLS